MLADLAEMGRDMAYDEVVPTFVYKGRTLECVPSSNGQGSSLLIGGVVIDVALTLVVPRTEFITVDSTIPIDDPTFTTDQGIPVAGDSVLYEDVIYKILKVTESAFKGSVSLQLGDYDQ